MRVVERNHLPEVQAEPVVTEALAERVGPEAACYPAGVAERFLVAAAVAYQSCVLPMNSVDAFAPIRER